MGVHVELEKTFITFSNSSNDRDKRNLVLPVAPGQTVYLGSVLPDAGIETG